MKANANDVFPRRGGRVLLRRLLGRASAGAGHAAIALHGDRVCVVHAISEPGRRPRIVRAAVESIATGEAVNHALSRAARSFDLKRLSCTTVLNEADYKLLLAEAPDVPQQELRQALRWRVKDLIDFHINDATLDVFELPGEKTRGAVREMYVVAARSDAIRQRVDHIESVGANLQVIDIPELAQRNIAALLPEDAQGVALLALQPNTGLITITQQGALYLARPLAFGWEALADEERRAEYYDQIVLEAQRSLDYFESHFRQAPVRLLSVAPMAVDAPDLIGHLSANLGVQVAALDLGAFMDVSGLPEGAAPWCLTSLGAALRREAVTL